MSDSTLRVFRDAPSKSDGNGDILGYYIVYDQPGIPYRQVQESSCTNENCSDELINLEAFTNFSVGVMTYKSRSNGPTSKMVKQTTSEGKPHKLELVNCEAISSTEIHVSWKSLSSKLV